MNELDHPATDVLHFPFARVLQRQGAPAQPEPARVIDLAFYATFHVRATLDEVDDIEYFTTEYRQDMQKQHIARGRLMTSVYEKLFAAHAFEQATEDVLGTAVDPFKTYTRQFFDR